MPTIPNRFIGRLYAVLAPAVLAFMAAPAAAVSPPAGEAPTEIVMSSLSGSYLAGRLAGNERDVRAAAHFFRGALERDPGNSNLLDRALSLSLVAGDMEAAMELASRVVERDESHRVGRLALAVERIGAGDYAEARSHIEAAGNGPLTELTHTLLLAWIDSGLGETDAALERIAGLAGPDWYEVFKPYHSGLIAELDGDHDRAGAFFAEAFGDEGGALRVTQVWARHLAAEGRHDEALDVIAGFDDVVPDHPKMAQAAAIVAAGEVPPPVVSSIAEGAAEVLYGIGSALGSDSGEEIAALYLQLGLYLAPGQPLALLSLADYYEKVDDRVHAIEIYDRVPEGTPLRRNADIQRALNYNDLDRLDESRELLEALIADNPEDGEAIVALANILRGHREFAEAAEIYSQAVALIDTPRYHHWTLYYFRGIAYERSDQWDKAEADFKQALELHPDQPYVLNYLGYSWIDQNVRLDEAKEMIVRAVEQRPDDGYIVDSLGWAHYRLGQYEEAVAELERAVELRPEDPIINDHLGDAYWKVGRNLEARFQWAHARDLDPEPEDLEMILEKLEHGLPEDRARSAAELRREAD